LDTHDKQSQTGSVRDVTSLHEPASRLDRLPPDQHAVLEMVLARRHSYDEIARLLSIDRGAVRQRALAALDALGPATRISPQRRALITDYLLGQLPPRVSDEVRDHLTQSAAERAWARVVATELASLSSGALPAIPSGTRETGPADAGETAFAGVAEQHSAAQRSEATFGAVEDPPRRVSRVGGAILLGAAAAAGIAAILIFGVFGVGSATTHRATASNAGASKPASTKTPLSPRPLAQINLTPPTKSKALGIAEIIKAGNATGIVIVAQGLKPNSRGDSYAIWLYNSPTSVYRLGYVVTSNGRLQTAGRLPANASSYRQLIVALQKGASNRVGKIVLRGRLSGL
jgi:hypothetical protein